MLAALLLLSACSAGAASAPRPSGTPQAGRAGSAELNCRLSSRLVPSCGALWGISTNPETYSALTALERKVGRSFDIVYTYHDIDARFPTDEERREAREGRILHIAVAARQYGAIDKSAVTWSAVASGKFDAALAAQARGVAALHQPLFITFEQEADQQRKFGKRGTAEDFRRAWRHVHDIYVREGATNAVWVWAVTGYPPNFGVEAQLWPGNDVVDWISWNPYNRSRCTSNIRDPAAYRSFETGMLDFYRWVHKDGPAAGIDPNKPMMISETGSVTYSQDPALTARWYREIPQTLERFPQIKAVTLWDSLTSTACDYRFDRNPTVLRAVAQAGHDPWVNVRRS